MRILVVEDEMDMNRLLVKTLKREGYSVDGCFDGEEAWLHLMGAEYDAVVLDVMMPKKDGYTLIQELRDKGKDIPVLFLTAKDSIADRVKGLERNHSAAKGIFYSGISFAEQGECCIQRTD